MKLQGGQRDKKICADARFVIHTYSKLFLPVTAVSQDSSAHESSLKKGETACRYK